jgi:hypothetical protein
MATDKREETPDILGDVLDPDETGGSSSTEKTDDTDENQQGREEARDSSGKEGGVDQSNGTEDSPKRKATYYLREDTLSQLEEVWFQLRQRADEGQKRKVSKSAIVEVALEAAIDELESDEGGDAILQRLMG